MHDLVHSKFGVKAITCEREGGTTKLWACAKTFCLGQSKDYRINIHRYESTTEDLEQQPLIPSSERAK